MQEGMQEGWCDQNGLKVGVRQRHMILCANPKDSSLKENYTEMSFFIFLQSKRQKSLANRDEPANFF